MSQKSFKEYEYFDTPDGEDTVKKLWVATKFGGGIALTAATADVLLFSHPKGYAKTLGRYAYITLPLLGMSTAFVMISNIAANVRQKDDKANWILGALTAGGIFGAWRKSTQAGFAACVALSAAAALKKHAIQENWTLLPPIRPRDGGIRSVRHDWTLIKDPGKTWRTE